RVTYHGVMKLALRGITLIAFAAFAVAIADRLWRTPALGWNWAALILLAIGVGASVIGLRRRESKPRWYHLRPGMIAAGCLVLLAAWFVVRVPAPMGDGPAGPDVASAPFEQTWSERPVVL